MKGGEKEDFGKGAQGLPASWSGVKPALSPCPQTGSWGLHLQRGPMGREGCCRLPRGAWWGLRGGGQPQGSSGRGRGLGRQDLASICLPHGSPSASQQKKRGGPQAALRTGLGTGPGMSLPAKR